MKLHASRCFWSKIVCATLLAVVAESFASGGACAQPLPSPIRVHGGWPERVHGGWPELPGNQAPRAAAPGSAPWTNPLASPNSVFPDLPQGLQLVGDDGTASSELDPGLNTVIFVHGWSQGQRPTFLAAADWRRRGFNPLIFRWHDGAYNSYLLAQTAADQVAIELADDLGKLQGALDGAVPGGYRGEIRLVAEDLGAWVALKAVREAWSQGKARTGAPLRVDLLDPALESATEQNRVGDAGRALLETLLKQPAASVVAFLSSSHRAEAAQLERVMPVQVSTRGARGSKNGELNSLSRVYLSSIRGPRPRLEGGGFALSALTPTFDLSHWRPGRITQISGETTVDMADDVYRKDPRSDD